jgi:uncharacterized membrane protein YhaH (DUF805 family)
METPAQPLPAHGRIAPRPFAVGVVAVYALSFLSQVLMSSPVTVRFGVLPFAILQALLTWAWFVLHARRLRDAGRPIGPAIAIAVLYVLAMVLLLLLLLLLLLDQISAVGTAAPRPSLSEVWVFLLLFSTFAGEATLGFFHVLALGILALILAPVAIAIGFSIWTCTRPAVAGAVIHP